MNSWKAFSASCWLWKCFPCKKLSRCLKKRQLAGKSPGGHCRRRSSRRVQPLSAAVPHATVMLCTRTGPFCWPAPAAGGSFRCVSIDLLSVLLGCNCFVGIQKAIVDQTGSRPPDCDYVLSSVPARLWEVLWSFLSVQPPTGLVCHCLSCKIRFLLHVTIR